LDSHGSNPCWSWRKESCSFSFDLRRTRPNECRPCSNNNNNNKKVSYRKQIARQHLWSPCINLSHIQFDHHAKYGCCFSYCVHPCSRSQKCWGRWVPGLSDRGVADPWKHASPHLCHHTKFGCNKKNCVGTGRIPKIAALGCHMADPLETTILHLCYRTKFGLSVLVSLDVGRGSQKIWRTLDQAPLGRGRG